MLTMGLTELTGVYLTCLFVIPEDGESFIFYLNALDTTEKATDSRSTAVLYSCLPAMFCCC